MYYGFFGKPFGAEPDPLGVPFGKPFGFGKPIGKSFGKGSPYGARIYPQPGGYSKVTKTPYGFSYNTVSKLPI
ncbi:MAG: hypothetical protein K0R39_4200 [Symbiobacteriaceae bacterium]|nr:hypothetical protein [Symbiobacteriaceae bacterium]